MSLFAELKRRKVFRVTVAYAVLAWLLIEVSDTVFPRLGLPEWTVTLAAARCSGLARAKPAQERFGQLRPPPKLYPEGAQGADASRFMVRRAAR
jgi:hypothetical protein